MKHFAPTQKKRDRSDPLERLTVFLESDQESGERHLASIAEALSEGHFTAIVLMDRLSQRLRDLISFLNDNSRFQLLAVELDYYRHDGTEIVSPRVYGAEGRRNVGDKGPKTVNRDPGEWLTDWQHKFGEEVARAWQRFVESLLARGIPEVVLGHYPRGKPYIALTGENFGQVFVFRLSDAAAEVRDDLFRNSRLFDSNPLARDAREQFRTSIKQSILSAYEGGSAGRVYLPVVALGENKESVIKAIADLALSLRSVGATETSDD